MLGYSDVNTMSNAQQRLQALRGVFELERKDIDLPVVPENSVPELPVRAKPPSA